MIKKPKQQQQQQKNKTKQTNKKETGEEIHKSIKCNQKFIDSCRFMQILYLELTKKFHEKIYQMMNFNI